MMTGKQDKTFTMEEFYDTFGWECERCNHFNVDDYSCSKGHRPREYTFEDGPNEFCHAIRFCMQFSQWVDEGSNDESIKNALSFALSSAAQQYC